MSTIINHEHIAWSACAQGMGISKKTENNNNNDTRVEQTIFQLQHDYNYQPIVCCSW